MNLFRRSLIIILLSALTVALAVVGILYYADDVMNIIAPIISLIFVPALATLRSLLSLKLNKIIALYKPVIFLAIISGSLYLIGVPVETLLDMQLEEINSGISGIVSTVILAVVFILDLIVLCTRGIPSFISFKKSRENSNTHPIVSTVNDIKASSKWIYTKENGKIRIIAIIITVVMILCVIFDIVAVAYYGQMNGYFGSYDRNKSGHDAEEVLDHEHSYYEEIHTDYIIIKCRNCGYKEYEYFPTS